MLFENKERISQDSKPYVENDWEYLDRSGRIEAQRVRDFLSHWISEYPESCRDELISRIKSGGDRALQSTSFELILFALLKSLGCSITVHPDLPDGKSKHPDFLVVTPEGESVFLEAVLASEYSESDISARKRADVVLNAIDKIESPNFFLGVNSKGHSERPPKGRPLRKALEQWLTSLDPDLVNHDISIRGDNAIPRFTWKYEDWSIIFEARPKKPERRGQGQRVIGPKLDRMRGVNVSEPIREAVKKKGKHYGLLPHTLIVAINVDSISGDRIDEIQGLYGQEEYILSEGDLSYPPQMHGKPNGAWFGKKGPQYKRVSGAWIFHGLSPWNIVSIKNTLYFNPWATKPLPTIFTTLHHARVEGDQIQWVDGRSIGEILGLPAKWPE